MLWASPGAFNYWKMVASEGGMVVHPAICYHGHCRTIGKCPVKCSSASGGVCEAAKVRQDVMALPRSEMEEPCR